MGLVRPDGHQWTVEEIAAMSVEEFDANSDAIRGALGELGRKRADERAEVREARFLRSRTGQV